MLRPARHEGTLISQNIGGVSHFVADLGVVIKDGVTAWPRRLRARRRGDHQPPGGGGPASQQHRGLHAVLLRRQADGFPGGARPLGRYRRPVDRLRRAGRLDPWAEGLQLDQFKIYEPACRTTSSCRSSRTIFVSRKPPWAICARRSPPASLRCAGSTSCTSAMAQRPSRPPWSRSIREAERKCRAVVETIPDGIYEADNYIDAAGRQGAAGPRPCQSHRQGRRHGDRLHRDASADRGQQQFAHAGGRRISPTRA